MGDAPPPRRRPAVRLGITLVGCVVAFAAGEMVLRVSASLDAPPEQHLPSYEDAEAPLYTGRCQSEFTQASLGELVRPSPANDIVYELKPGINTCFNRTRLRTNGAGFRGTVTPRLPKPDNVHRVVLLGDGYAFGRGVVDDQTFAAQLTAMLSARAPTRKVEIINAAVPGYSTAQQAAVLKHKGMALQPDCILVFYVHDDLDPPHLMEVPSIAWASDRSYLAEFIAGALTGYEFGQMIELGPALPHPGRVTVRLPARYEHMHGVPGFRRAMQSIKKSAGDVPVLVFGDMFGRPSDDGSWERDRDLGQQLLTVLAQVGVPFLSVTWPYKEAFWVRPDDRHPNAAVHRMVAEKVMAELVRRKACLP